MSDNQPKHNIIGTDSPRHSSGAGASKQPFSIHKTLDCNIVPSCNDHLLYTADKSEWLKKDADENTAFHYARPTYLANKSNMQHSGRLQTALLKRIKEITKTLSYRDLFVSNNLNQTVLDSLLMIGAYNSISEEALKQTTLSDWTKAGQGRIGTLYTALGTKNASVPDHIYRALNADKLSSRVAYADIPALYFFAREDQLDRLVQSELSKIEPAIWLGDMGSDGHHQYSALAYAIGNKALDHVPENILYALSMSEWLEGKTGDNTVDGREVNFAGLMVASGYGRKLLHIFCLQHKADELSQLWHSIQPIAAEFDPELTKLYQQKMLEMLSRERRKTLKKILPTPK